MFRNLRKLVLLMLVGMLVMSFAQAETGDGMKQMQMKLYNMGFMEVRPDGVDGPQTQDGVRALQRYLGIEETGTADEATLAALDGLWNLAIGTEEEAVEPVDEGMYAAHCAWLVETDEEETVRQAQHCFRHAAVQKVLEQMNKESLPERLEQLLTMRVCAMWMAAIDDMYDEMAEFLSREEKHIADEQRDAFRTTLVKERKAFEEQYGKATVAARQAEMAWLEDFGMELCMQLYGAEAHGE